MSTEHAMFMASLLGSLFSPFMLAAILWYHARHVVRSAIAVVIRKS